MNYSGKNIFSDQDWNRSLINLIPPALLMDTIEQGMIVTDPEGTISFANKAARNVLNFPISGDLNGMKFNSLLSPTAETLKFIDEAILNGKKANLKNEILKRNDGISFRLDFKINPIIYEETTIGAYIIFKDTRLEKKVKYLEQASQVFLESSEKGVIQFNEKGKPVCFNKALSTLTGLSAASLSGDYWLEETFSTKFADNGDSVNKESLFSQIKDKTDVSFDLPFYRSGNQISLKATGKALILSGKSVGYIFSIEPAGTLNSSISGKENQDGAISETESRLELALLSAGVGIWDFNPFTHQLTWDKRCKELFGLPTDTEVDFEKILKRIHPEDRPLFIDAVNNSMNPEIQAEFDIHYRIIRTKDVVVRWIYAKGKAYFNENREVNRFIGTMLDLTDKKLNELRIIESEKRFKLLADSAPVFIWLTQNNQELEYVNNTWEEYLELGSFEHHDRKQHFHPDDLENLDRIAGEAYKTQAPYTVECRIRRRNDSEWRWTLFSGVPRFIKENVHEGYIVVGTDIHERKEAEKALQESLTRFRFLAESMPQKLWLTDATGKIEYLNRKWLEYIGIPPEEVIARGWKKIIHARDQAECKKIWNNAFETGEYSEVEARLLNRDGEYRWHLTRGSALRDENGNIQMWVGTSIDIHDKKIAIENLARANKQLTKTNTDLDNFIYTASHDLKAPISNLEGLLTAFSEEGKLNEQQTNIMEMMVSSVERFKTTIKDLTEITKAQRVIEEDLQSINLRGMLEEVKLDMRELIERFDPVIKYRLGVREINFSRKNLRSIVYNILSNALKYSSPERRPEIVISTTSSNGFILLCIKDNGLGISEENQGKIFGMFKRAHQHVEGSGIGLYIIKRMIENSGGKIDVESKEDHGSVFKIYLKKT